MYTYECLCRCCGEQFALKHKDAEHICPSCEKLELTLEEAQRLDSETLLAFRDAPNGRFGFRDQEP